MNPPSAARTARERARAEITAMILDTARAHLGVAGASALSLRAVARELDMTSSAVYRYYPSRDNLVTALLVQVYDEIGEQAEAAVAAAPTGSAFRQRWRVMATSIRRWALQHPHDYALLYGSPVPGYAAPEETVGPAARIPLLLISLLKQIHDSGRDPGEVASSMPVPAHVQQSLRGLREFAGPYLSDDLLVRGLMAWTHVYGAISFELFGHLVGAVEDYNVWFDHQVDRLADMIEL
jgi:AcrR family transcriptional regulator